MNVPTPPRHDPEHDPARQRRSTAATDLPADRRILLKEQLMTSLDHARRTERRRRTTLRIAVPVALAAAAAGILVARPFDSAGHPAVAADHRAATPSATADPAHVETVAYTLDRGAHGVVTITVHRTGADRPDVARLQKDLAGLGVDARVYQGKTCSYHPKSHADGSAVPKGEYFSVWTMATENRHGDFVARLDPRKLPAGMHVGLAFPVDAFNTAKLAVSFGTTPSSGPACLHLPETGPDAATGR